MSDKHQQPNGPGNLTRRELMRDGAVAAAGIAIGVGAAGCQQEQPVQGPAAVQQTRSYNPDMKYRRLGKTGLWVSSVCMGGHWKRIETMAPKALQGDNWLGASLSDEDFKKNRRDVVTRAMESGINYIDACTKSEVLAYSEALRDRRDKMFLGCSWYEEEMRNPNFQTSGRPARDPGKGHEGSRARVRRSLADHHARAERSAHAGPGRGNDEGPRNRTQARKMPLHRPLLTRPSRTSRG